MKNETIDYGKVMLKNTSNEKCAFLVGRHGDLIFHGDGKFSFFYDDDTGIYRCLSSAVVGIIGDLRLQASNEMSIKTERSVYTFVRA